jgi:Flp pilus assembly protein TadG
MSRRAGFTERGAAALEMAIVLPLLILILGGIIDYGRAFFTQIVLANAAREGARAAVVLANPVTRANAASTGIVGWQTPTVSGGVGNAGTCVGSTPATAPVTVVTSATFSYFFAGVLPGVSSTTTLQSRATMGCL